MGGTEAALLDMPQGRSDRSKRESKPKESKARRGASAEEMASRQRDISVSEFFAKNRHLLGFDNPRKALLTAVKEAVDNALDACEEAGILPSIVVAIEDLEPGRPATARSGRYRLTVVDNGPGIVRKQVENIFGRLLYGSKFHRLKMSRGQQGIGISAAGMYGLITTGQPMVIHTKPGPKASAHHIELAMNTKTNRAEVTVDRVTDDFPPKRLSTVTAGAKALARSGTLLETGEFASGTSVSIELEGRYQRGRGSVEEFLELTAIANPHARIVLIPPTRESAAEEEDLEPKLLKAALTTPADTVSDGVEVRTSETLGCVNYPRAVNELPAETREIQPHPRGIELGTLLQMLKEYEATTKGSLFTFLQERFCRVSSATAASICSAVGVTSRTRISSVDAPLAEAIYRAFQTQRFLPPPTDCLSPIGVRQLLAGMLKGVRAEFYAASSRDAEVYRGRPFQIEAAIAFGGELPADESARVIRFANRVPLLFQQSACSSFRAVAETGWRNYGLQQPRGGLPVGPLVIAIHMASVWVPFTSESKEAIADYDEIRKEMKLALMECGRKLGTYLRRRQRMAREGERRDVFERYIGEIVQAVHAINGTDPKKLFEKLQAQARALTAVADQVLDEEGRVQRDEEDLDALDGVIVVASPSSQPVVTDTPPSGGANGTKAVKGTKSAKGAKVAKRTSEANAATAKAADAPARQSRGAAAKAPVKDSTPAPRLRRKAARDDDETLFAAE
ncbi:MAG: DNA topoisomerase VI subunit B [Phycisphaeraceae bacterium]|nr:DNA topoisomerase VI subunit B [Phycisphaeraceae bacterium]